MYTPVYQCLNDGMVLLPEGTIVATAGSFVKMCVFYNTCQALLADQLGSSGIAAQFDKLSAMKNTTKNLRSHIYMKIQKYCNFIIFIC